MVTINKAGPTGTQFDGKL